MISVIVPVYNALRYLSECVESILNQTYQDIELILVNDGSTDETKNLCIDYMNCDQRVKYIEKENGGVSSARNVGLQYANGEYIAFVDSDDYLAPHIFEFAINEMNNYHADLLGWNAYSVNQNRSKKCREIQFSDNHTEHLYAALIANYHADFYCGDYIRAVWGKLFKRSIIAENDIFFHEDLYIGEDAVFILEYIAKAKKTILINEYGYYYRILSSSAVRRYKPDLYQQSIVQAQSIEKIGINKDDMYTIAITVFYWRILHNLLSNSVLRKCNRDYSDVYRWYEVMKTQVTKKYTSIPWAGKLVNLQMLLGTRVPVGIHIWIMRGYDWVKKLHQKQR